MYRERKVNKRNMVVMIKNLDKALEKKKLRKRKVKLRKKNQVKMKKAMRKVILKMRRKKNLKAQKKSLQWISKNNLICNNAAIKQGDKH